MIYEITQTLVKKFPNLELQAIELQKDLISNLTERSRQSRVCGLKIAKSMKLRNLSGRSVYELLL